MNTHANKTQKNIRQSVANEISQKQNGVKSTFQCIDNRPDAERQRKSQEMADNSPQAMQLKVFQEMADNSTHQIEGNPHNTTKISQLKKKKKHKGSRLLKTDRKGWEKIELGMNYLPKPTLDGNKNPDGYFYEFSYKTQFSTIYYRTKVKPFPTEVLNFNGQPPSNPECGGITVKIDFTANTNDKRDIFDIEESEKVSASTNHTGILTHKEIFQSSNSDYMPISEAKQDRHWRPKNEFLELAKTYQPDDASQNDEIGSYEVKQHDTYRDENEMEKVIEKSGYSIKTKVILKRLIDDADNEYSLITEKAAEGVGGAKAGPSEKQEATTTL